MYSSGSKQNSVIPELCEAPGGNLVDGLPPAQFRGAGELVGKKNLDGSFGDFCSVENFVLEIQQLV
eukprot:5191777-Pyramimonas_sp.AAC.1